MAYDAKRLVNRLVEDEDDEILDADTGLLIGSSGWIETDSNHLPNARTFCRGGTTAFVGTSPSSEGRYYLSVGVPTGNDPTETTVISDPDNYVRDALAKADEIIEKHVASFRLKEDEDDDILDADEFLDGLPEWKLTSKIRKHGINAWIYVYKPKVYSDFNASISLIIRRVSLGTYIYAYGLDCNFGYDWPAHRTMVSNTRIQDVTTKAKAEALDWFNNRHLDEDEGSVDKNAARPVYESNVLKALTEDEDDDILDAADMAQPYVYPEYDLLHSMIQAGTLTLHGKVTRTSYHYVHQQSTTCDVDRDFDPNDSSNPEQEAADLQVNKLEDEIKEKMVGWNTQIYKNLEKEYDYAHSDEQIEESIVNNDYKFDEDGRRDDTGTLGFMDLEPEAQRAAREWYKSSMEIDNFWSESTIEEWKALLEAKGFMKPEISWCGFWNQGDGASFTCDHIDFEKYFTGTDPLEAYEALSPPPAESPPEVTESLPSASTWKYTIHAFPTCKSISYSLKEGKSVGGHTFPRKTNDSELKALAESQIKQFNRAGQFNPSKWNDVWQWLASTRK